MTQFIVDNKDVLYFCASVLGILLSLAFGGIRSWHHHICDKYRSLRDVAVSILEDRFVQRTCGHYSDVADERKRHKTAVEDIYKRPEQRQLIRELAQDLKNQNRVKRLFRWLVRTSRASFGFLWAAITVVLSGIPVLWAASPPFVWIIWSVLLGVLLLGFIASVSGMWILDGRFFRLADRIIEAEGE